MFHIVCRLLPEFHKMRDKYHQILHTFVEYVCVKYKIDSNPNADISLSSAQRDSNSITIELA